MEFKQISLTLAAALALGLVSCSKNESVALTADDASKTTRSSADAVSKTAEATQAEAAHTAVAARNEAANIAEAAKSAATQTTEPAKTEAAKAAEAASAQAAKTADGAKTAEAAKAPDKGKVQELIDKAKSLIAENKLSDASSVLQQLAGRPLSGEQTKLVDGLKEQIQQALVAKAAQNASGSVGNLLKK